MRESIFKNIDSADSDSVRYLLYLSRNDQWVPVKGDIYKLTIKHIVKETLRHENGKTIRAEEHEAVHQDASSEMEDALKLKLSHREFSRSVLAGGYCDQYYGEHTELVAPLNLDVDAFNYDRFAVSLYDYDKKDPDLIGGNHLTCICLHVKNFDKIFDEAINNANTDEERQKLIANYDQQKILAKDEAIKNRIWLAAASGDHKLLAELLEDENQFDFTTTFKGKTILNAMLNATAENTPAFTYIIPLNNPEIDYAKTLDVLIEQGLDNKMLQDFYDACMSNNQAAPMFPKPVNDPNGLLPMIKSRLERQYDAKPVIEMTM